MLFTGDIIISVALFSTLLVGNFFHISMSDTADIIITPACIMWAIIHFKAMLNRVKADTIH